MDQCVFSTQPIYDQPKGLKPTQFTLLTLDLFNSPAAHGALKLINKAWAVLGDETMREIYDVHVGLRPSKPKLRLRESFFLLRGILVFKPCRNMRFLFLFFLIFNLYLIFNFLLFGLILLRAYPYQKREKYGKPCF